MFPDSQSEAYQVAFNAVWGIFTAIGMMFTLLVVGVLVALLLAFIFSFLRTMWRGM